MKTTQKFSTLELVTYSQSNRTKEVYFETLEQAIDFAKTQKELHPRTKKLSGNVIEHNEGADLNKTYNIRNFQ